MLEVIEMLRFDILVTCAMVSLLLAWFLYMVKCLMMAVASFFGCAAVALFGAVVAIVDLCIDAVTNWMQSNKVARTDYGRIVGQRLASGNYRVVAGVFSSGDREIASRTWNDAALDNDLRRRLENGNGMAIVSLA